MLLRNALPAIAAATIALTFHACSGDAGSDEKDNKIVFTSVNRQALYRLDNTARIYNTDNDIAYQNSASLLIPVEIYGYNLDALKDSIIKVAFDTVATDINTAIDSYFKGVVGDLGYKYSTDDSIARSDWDGMTIVTGDVFCMTTRMLTYRISNYTYSPGAAHGLTATNYITFNLENGRIMGLNEIFTTEGMTKLPALIKARAAELAPAIGPTNIESLPAQGNFYITADESIVFIYQPYEVASYAQGAIAIPFYPYQLSELMTPDGLAFFGMNS